MSAEALSVPLQQNVDILEESSGLYLLIYRVRMLPSPLHNLKLHTLYKLIELKLSGMMCGGRSLPTF